MKKTVLILLFILTLTGAASAAPKNIISLSPVGTEILYALGQEDKITGVTSYCDYPPEAAKKPKVADYFNGMNLESLLARRVDLVVVSDLHESLIPRLETLGIKHVIVKQTNIQDVYASIRALGKACDVPQKSNMLVRNIQQDLDGIKKRIEKYGRPATVICVSRELSDPAIRFFYAAGNETFYSDLLEIAGGHNLVKSRFSYYQRISYEGMTAFNPEVIIDIVGDKSAYHDNVKNSDLNLLFDKHKLKSQWQRAFRVKATQSGRVYIFGGTVFLRPGPRMAQIALSFARALHPKAFK